MPLARTIVVVLLSLLTVAEVMAQRRFEGDFDFRWVPDMNGLHTEMKLLTDVAFIDASGTSWPVPAGEQTDGASIPWFIWSAAGSPFTGRYRRAAVIHDYYCKLGTYPAEAVHIVFLEGMIADGTPFREAESKYSAVRLYDQSLGRGGCGIQGRPVDRLRELGYSPSEEDLGVVITEEVLATLESFDFTPLSEWSLPERTALMVDLAQIERRGTYESLVQFAAAPSPVSYDAIEGAILEERPTLVQLDLLIELARGTVPTQVDGFACC